MDAPLNGANPVTLEVERSRDRKSASKGTNPQGLQSIYKVRRIRRFEFNRGAPSRVCETELKRVQHLPRWSVSCQLLQLLVLPMAVSFVPDQRMAQELKMHSNLVSATRVKLRGHERCSV